MIYELRQYDKTLLKFEYVEKSLSRECHILEVSTTNSFLLPIGLELTEEGLFSWLKSRIIPKNREFVEQLLSKMGLSHNDVFGIIKICKGLSLNDSYWIVEEGFVGKFKDYNLYDNEFSKALALIAYTGYGSTQVSGFTSTPEFTTSGMLPKCWRRINNKIYLYKAGTSGMANTGMEPYSEFYAYQIAKTMGLDCVEYKLAKWKKNVCSVCELFTNIDVSYVPMHRFIKKNNLKETASFLKEMGEEFYNSFVDMLVFDALIYNTDRHYGNFGLLVDNKTNKPIKFAPLFDHGLSLFNYAMENDLDNIEEYSKTRTSAFGFDFLVIAKEFITERQKAMLRKLINFKFERHKTYNWSQKRKKIIEKHLQNRIMQLLD